MKRLRTAFWGLGAAMLNLVPLFAQEPQDSIAEAANEYITGFPDRITTNVFFVNTYNSYRFSDRFSPLVFELFPNKQDRIGFAASYEFLAFSFSFAPDFLADNRDNLNSRLFNLNLAAFPGQWMQTLDIYAEKGYYLEAENGRAYLPDTKSLKVGGRTAYIFNDQFSMKAVVNQNEKQSMGAGSLIPGFSYFYSEFDLRYLGEEEIRGKMYSFDIAFAPAYYYNFVPVNNLLFSVGGSVGIGMNISRSDQKSLTSLLTEFSYDTAIVWDVDNFYLGGRYRYLALNHNSDQVTQTNDQVPVFNLFLGYRFKAPEKLVKTYKKLLSL